MSPKLRSTARPFGLETAHDNEKLEKSQDLLAARRVDDVNVAVAESDVDRCVHGVERVFGPCELSMHSCTDCAVRYS